MEVGRPGPGSPRVSVISRRNQMTLPADALEAAGLAPGDDVRVAAVAPGRLILTPIDELVQEFAGVFDATIYPPGYLDDPRRERL
ncbi:MAG: AbrB/MazE/SpoVT family DNA-binding domain-containing protein [Gaiellaceae bacterium]